MSEEKLEEERKKLESAILEALFAYCLATKAAPTFRVTYIFGLNPTVEVRATIKSKIL